MSVYKKMMEEIFNALCIHSEKYKPSRPISVISQDDFHCFGEVFMLPELFDGWKECESCILRNINWKINHTMGKIDRDICFAIWHEGVFERPKSASK